MWSPNEGNEENTDTISSADIKIEDSDCDMSEDACSITSEPATGLPEKTKLNYEATYTRFKEWCEKKGIYKITEDDLFDYLVEKSQKWKSSTLWAEFSKIKAVVPSRPEACIKNHTKVTDFLKKLSKGYKALKSETFSREQITKFLEEAPDQKYLMMKVLLILGITGSCNVAELTYISIDNIEDTGISLIVNITSPNTGQERSFIVNGSANTLMVELYRKYIALRPTHTPHRRLFVNYRNGKCSTQVVGYNTIGKIPSEIAKFLELKNADLYNGCCFRRSSAKLKAHTAVNILSLSRQKGVPSFQEDYSEVKEDNLSVFDNEEYKDISINVNREKSVEFIRIEDSKSMNSSENGNSENENVKISAEDVTLPKALKDLPFSFNNCTNCNFYIYLTHK